MQHTVRNIPDYLDATLRETARKESKSLNQVMVEALARGAGVAGQPVRHRDLSDLVGSWQPDPAFDAAIADQRRIDEEMWR